MKKNNTKSKIGWAIAILVIVGILMLFVYSLGKNSPSSYPKPNSYSTIYTTIPQVYTLSLFSQGQVFSINAGSYEYSNFTIPQGAYSVNITGSYTSQGKVEVAILTQAQYGAFTQNPSSISSSPYYYGDTQGSTINAQLSQGSYVLVFYDPGVLTQDTVTIVNPIAAKYTS